MLSEFEAGPGVLGGWKRGLRLGFGWFLWRPESRTSQVFCNLLLPRTVGMCIDGFSELSLTGGLLRGGRDLGCLWAFCVRAFACLVCGLARDSVSI